MRALVCIWTLGFIKFSEFLKILLLSSNSPLLAFVFSQPIHFLSVWSNNKHSQKTNRPWAVAATRGGAKNCCNEWFGHHSDNRRGEVTGTRAKGEREVICSQVNIVLFSSCAKIWRICFFLRICLQPLR